MHNGLLWILFEKFGASFLSVAVFFVFALYLSPSDLGLAFVILSVTQFCALLINTYFEDALVQKKTITQTDTDTVFWASFFISVGTMILISFGFFMWALLKNDWTPFWLALFASLEIPLTNLGTTYVASLRRDGKFKILALRVVLGKVIGSLVALALAVAHTGTFAIITQSVLGMIIQLAVLFHANPILPQRNVDFSSLKNMHHYGLMLTLRRLSWDAFVRMTPLAAGIVGGTGMAGIVGFGWKIVELFRGAISSGLSGYLLPFMARDQDNQKKMASDFLLITRITALIVTPVFLGLAVVAPNLIHALFDPKWEQTIPVIQVFSFAALISCYRVPATIYMNAAGKPGAMLFVDTITSISCIVFMLFCGHYGAWVIAFAHLIFNLSILPKSYTVIKKLSGFTPYQQTIPILTHGISGLIMASTTVLASLFLSGISSPILLALEISLGTLVFALSIFLLHRNEIQYWLSFIGYGAKK